MPLRQEDTKTVRRGPQVLSKRRLPNTIDMRRASLPPPGRVVGVRAAAVGPCSVIVGRTVESVFTTPAMESCVAAVRRVVAGRARRGIAYG